jgi:hypothetical protein
MGWPAWWGVVALLVLLLDGVLISDALYQILQGKPSFLPLERLVRKRVPATPPDCIVYGVSRLLIYVGMLLVQLPLFLITNLGPVGLQLQHALGLTLMVSAGISLALVVSAAIIEARVHFTPLGSAVSER